MVTLDEVLAAVSSRLAALGFVLADDTGIGPMGSRLVRFTRNKLAIEFINDRGSLTVAAGRRRDPTFNGRVWADVLGVEFPPPVDISESVTFFFDNLDDINGVIESDPAITSRLRDVNWRFVKAYLGLSPDMPRPGEKHG